jgi:hypothetical protein
MKQREQLAAVQHKIWSDWVRHLFEVSAAQADGTVVIPPEHVKQWWRQMNTDYNDLSEEEKDGDRRQVDKLTTLLDQAQKF